MEKIFLADIHNYEKTPEILQKKIDNYLVENKKIVIKIVEIRNKKEFTTNLILQNDNENIEYILSGILNTKLKYSKLYQDYYFFHKMQKFYQKRVNILNSLCFDKPKIYFFDALMGEVMCRENKNFVINFINKNHLYDKIILKYFQTTTDLFYKQNNKVEFEFGINVDFNALKNKVGTYEEIMYDNENITISQILPIEVYNKSAYSIIAETNYDNSLNFYTEKTFKPILAKRLFIVFAGQNHLKNLKEHYGFKTFDGIIDESYDLIENQEIRWTEASKQILYLINSPQDKILKSLKEIVDFNQNHMLNNFPSIYNYFD